MAGRQLRQAGTALLCLAALAALAGVRVSLWLVIFGCLLLV